MKSFPKSHLSIKYQRNEEVYKITLLFKTEESESQLLISKWLFFFNLLGGITSDDFLGAMKNFSEICSTAYILIHSNF